MFYYRSRALQPNLLQAQLALPKLDWAKQSPALENKPINRPEDEPEFLFIAGRQVDPEDPGVVVAEEESLPLLVTNFKKPAEVAAEVLKDGGGLQEDAPTVAPAEGEERLGEVRVRAEGDEVGGGLGQLLGRSPANKHE